MRLAPILQPLTEPLLSPLVTAITGASGGGFSPISLFSGTDKGYIYDNNDLSSFYLDSAGTTPATVNGLVGLQLDKSQGLVLGAEMIPSLDLSSADWVTVGTLSAITANSFTNTSGATAGRQSTVYIAPGKSYSVSVSYTKTNAAVDFSIRANGSASQASSTANSGTLTCIIVATTNQFYLRLNGNDTLTVTSISVKELPGNHRYQTTTGSKPILRGTPVGSNTVSNPNFDSGTGWTLGTNWSIGSGVATSTGSNQFQALTRGDWSGVSGRVYKLTIDVSAYTSGSLLVRAGSGTNKGTISKGGVTELYFTADGAGLSLLSNATGFEFIGSITSIDVRDVSADSVTAPYGIQYDGVDDFLQTASVNFETATSDGLARRNLLTFPSAFDNAAWTKTRASISANAATSPDGLTTADKLIEDSTASNSHLTFQQITATASTPLLFSVRLKAAERTFAQVRLSDGGGNQLFLVNVNLSNGANTTGSFGSPSGTSSSVSDIGNGWYLVTVGLSIPYTNIVASVYIQDALGNNSYTGNGASGFYIWGAQLETGSTASTFQDIGTDKMAVVMGVRKLSDAARGMLVELGNVPGTNTFRVEAPPAAVAAYSIISGGSVTTSLQSTSSFAAPITNVLAGVADIAGDSLRMRLNGSEQTPVTSDQGTGNFGNYALYFGRRGGASLPYNGLDFGGICIGKTLTATQLANVEKWVAIRTGVTI